MSMDVSAPARSPWQRALFLLNTVFAVMLLALPSPGLGSDCTPNVNIPKDSKVGQSKDKSLSLRCPVSLCSQDLPNVTWCRTEVNGQCETVKLDLRISSGWENRTQIAATHVLRFHIFQINDTGFYKCSVNYKGLQIIGSVIEVIEVTFSAEAMTEPTTMDMLSSNSTSTPTSPSLGQFKILVYFMASAGGVCLLIIIISLIVFCHRRRHGKHGSSMNPNTEEELHFVATSLSPENCLERANVSCQAGKEFTTVPTEITYDNAHLGYRPSITLSTEEDSIVYADLNHDAKKAHFQFEAGNEVEYATVRLN